VTEVRLNASGRWSMHRCRRRLDRTVRTRPLTSARRPAAAAVALLAALLLTATVPASAAPGGTKGSKPVATSPAPELALHPTAGVPGTTVAVQGTGFERNTRGEIRFDGLTVPVRTNGSGSLQASVTVPEGPAVTLPLTATIGSRSATATFTRTVPVVADAPATTEPTAGEGPTSQRFDWSGHRWTTRAFQGQPAPHHRWDGGTDNVRVDDAGNLRLRLTRPGGHLTGAQLWTDPLGYGTYSWTIASRLDQLHPSVVLGLWTYDDDTPVLGNRELDIEFTRWGDASYWNTWFNVHPQEQTGASHGYFLGAQTRTTHSWTWAPGVVTFRSVDAGGRVLAEHTYRSTQFVPTPATEKVLMNLWVAPLGDWTSAPETEIVVERFTFTPLAG
jgi:hypothetical protein